MKQVQDGKFAQDSKLVQVVTPFGPVFCQQLKIKQLQRSKADPKACICPIFRLDKTNLQQGLEKLSDFHFALLPPGNGYFCLTEILGDHIKMLTILSASLFLRLFCSARC